jgi:hypothetical protein
VREREKSAKIYVCLHDLWPLKTEAAMADFSYSPIGKIVIFHVILQKKNLEAAGDQQVGDRWTNYRKASTLSKMGTEIEANHSFTTPPGLPLYHYTSIQAATRKKRSFRVARSPKEELSLDLTNPKKRSPKR